MELRSGKQGVEENNSTDKNKGKDFQKGSVKAKMLACIHCQGIRDTFSI